MQYCVVAAKHWTATGRGGLTVKAAGTPLEFPEYPGKHLSLGETSLGPPRRSPLTPASSCTGVSPQHTHLPRGFCVETHLEEPRFSGATETEKKGETGRDKAKKEGESPRMNCTLEERKGGKKEKFP